MIPDGTYTAVVDRFEDELAVLEVSGDDERYEHAVERAALPEDARNVDAVLELDIEDGELREARYEAEATESREEDAQSRFDRLSKRPPDPDERD